MESNAELDDNDFAPTVQEMEDFKRRMGIPPTVDPFGRGALKLDFSLIMGPLATLPPDPPMHSPTAGPFALPVPAPVSIPVPVSAPVPVPADPQETAIVPRSIQRPEEVSQDFGHEVDSVKKLRGGTAHSSDGSIMVTDDTSDKEPMSTTKGVPPPQKAVATSKEIFAEIQSFTEQMESYRAGLNGVLASLRHQMSRDPEEALADLRTATQGGRLPPPPPLTLTLQHPPVMDAMMARAKERRMKPGTGSNSQRPRALEGHAMSVGSGRQVEGPDSEIGEERVTVNERSLEGPVRGGLGCLESLDAGSALAGGEGRRRGSGRALGKRGGGCNKVAGEASEVKGVAPRQGLCNPKNGPPEGRLGGADEEEEDYDSGGGYGDSYAYQLGEEEEGGSSGESEEARSSLGSEASAGSLVARVLQLGGSEARCDSAGEGVRPGLRAGVGNDGLEQAWDKRSRKAPGGGRGLGQAWRGNRPGCKQLLGTVGSRGEAGSELRALGVKSEEASTSRRTVREGLQGRARNGGGSGAGPSRLPITGQSAVRDREVLGGEGWSKGNEWDEQKGQVVVTLLLDQMAEKETRREGREQSAGGADSALGRDEFGGGMINSARRLKEKGDCGGKSQIPGLGAALKDKAVDAGDNSAPRRAAGKGPGVLEGKGEGGLCGAFGKVGKTTLNGERTLSGSLKGRKLVGQGVGRGLEEGRRWSETEPSSRKKLSALTGERKSATAPSRLTAPSKKSALPETLGRQALELYHKLFAAEGELVCGSPRSALGATTNVQLDAVATSRSGSTKGEEGEVLWTMSRHHGVLDGKAQAKAVDMENVEPSASHER